MRLLLLSYDYLPRLNPRSLRWTSIVKEWTDAGHSVDVVTAWERGDAREEQQNGATIYRVSGSLRQWVPVPTGLSQDPQVPESGVASKFRRAISQMLRWIHQHTVRPLRWPDYAWTWHSSAYRQARRLCETRSYEALITVSYPFTPHVVGLRLKRRFPSMWWLADMGDPFSFLDASPLNNFRLFHRINREVEGRVFARSDAVSVTTPETCALYGQVFPKHSMSIRVIPPLLTLESTVSSDRMFPSGDGVIRLVYVGTVYRSLRNPTATLALLQEVRKQLSFPLELHVFGNVHDCAELFEESRDADAKFIYLHGSVPHPVALQAMRDADVLVSIGNDTPYQLPSKVVEYIASGKPILNISRHVGDSSAAFFSHYPRILALNAEPERWDPLDVDRVVRFLEASRTPSSVDSQALIRPFLSESIANEYLQMIQKSRER